MICVITNMRKTALFYVETILRGWSSMESTMLRSHDRQCHEIKFNRSLVLDALVQQVFSPLGLKNVFVKSHEPYQPATR